MPKLYFFHGMESSPKGTKARIIKRRYPNCVIPELPPDVRRRQQILRKLITGPSWLVGSSLGGLSALLLAMEKPELVKGMVLLAPAVGFFNEESFEQPLLKEIQQTFVPAGVPCVIIAGEYDDVIPLADIEAMAARASDQSRIILKKVKDNHSLNKFPDLLMEYIKEMIGSSIVE